jgi:hypothetical protein
VVLEGVATEVDADGFAVGEDDVNCGSYISNSAEHVVSVEKLEEPEPPVGSVVLDVDGDAWQRLHTGWGMVRADETASWNYVSTEIGGPPKIIYTPESK